MESTEHPLGVQHLPGCVALSRSAQWNQNEADWRLMLEIGYGWGLSLPDGTLAATTLVLPYGGDFAWVSMVLVHPAHRRKGYASRLLRTAIADLDKRRLTPILDATPAGQTVYRQEGFHDRWGFKRFFARRTTPPRSTGIKVRPIGGSDWTRILELDTEAFGASRERVLRSLQQRLPQAALIADGGFVFGRDGREARQIGPLVARDSVTARGLLAHALAAVHPPLCLDVADHAPLNGIIEASGFEFQRPFMRMVRGEHAVPGRKELTFLVAGPELG